MVNKKSNLKFFEINNLIFNILNKEEKKKFFNFYYSCIFKFNIRSFGN